MITYNNEHLITGYIKQLLSTFNLPKYRVYTKEDEAYHKWALDLLTPIVEEAKKVTKEKAIAEGKSKEEISKAMDAAEAQAKADFPYPLEAPDIIESIMEDIQKAGDDNKAVYYNTYNTRSIGYIKDGMIQYYVNGKWENANRYYYYDKKELNNTKNLVVKSNIYNAYTHEYLGNYLRFQRDYNDLDLMSMYNCFNDTICQNVAFKITNDSNITISTFNTTDKQYKIYMIPIKLFKKYTIAIDSQLPVEICCSLFSNYYMDELTVVDDLQNMTYKKYNSMSFNKPVIFDKLYIKSAKERTAEELEQDLPYTYNLSKTKLFDLIQHEADLKMFIKLPINNNSSITILEGDYTKGYNQSITRKIKKSETSLGTWTETVNRYVTNYELFTEGETWVEPKDEDSDYTKASKNYILPPIEDREFIPYSRLQLLSANTMVSHPFADRLIEYLLNNTITNTEQIVDNIKRAQTVLQLNGNDTTIDGLWNKSYRNIFYDYMLTEGTQYSNSIPHDATIDCLGYIDKDVEKYYTAWITKYRHDRNGKPIQVQEYNEETGTWEPKFEENAQVAGVWNPKDLVLAADSDREALKLIHKGEPIPVYETEVEKVVTISNVDIYPDIYKDSKK